MRERIHQLDYLKGIFILLMVLFHLAPVYENYPVLQAAVYTFHMAAFLIISGYLANIEKDVPNFCRGILRFIIPYIVFEIVHILLVYLMEEKALDHKEMELYKSLQRMKKRKN